MFSCKIFISRNPSVEWRSNKLFEYCVALDYYDNVASKEKLKCWINWTMIKNYNAPRHKRVHAYSRMNDLMAGMP